ncbi:MAG: hypothetical protein CMJ83_14385 [Planctomycetes bacterium]|nr:hypothetical protein [Planctomycetota bacterium]
MASHYDQSKNCRVGTMDEKQFYSEAGKASAAYFKALMAAWEKKGGTLKWGAGGVGLRGEVGGKEVGICFLAPAYGNKKDRIEFSLNPLAKQIGAPRCETLKTSLQKAAGDHLKGASMVSIVEPGDLSAAGQKSMTTALGKVIA